MEDVLDGSGHDEGDAGAGDQIHIYLSDTRMTINIPNIHPSITRKTGEY